MPGVNKTWKSKQTFQNGETVLGADTFGPMTGVVRVEIDRSSVPVGGTIEVKAQSRPVGSQDWVDEFSMKVIMDGNPNPKGGGFISWMQQPFSFAVNTEIRGVAVVSGGPFAFGVTVAASW